MRAIRAQGLFFISGVSVDVDVDVDVYMCLRRRLRFGFDAEGGEKGTEKMVRRRFLLPRGWWLVHTICLYQY